MKRHPAEHGKTVIATTTAQEGRWYRMDFISDTVFTSLTDYGADAADFWDVSIGGVTWPGGDLMFSMFGDFTRVKLASGAMVLYKQNVS